MYIFEQDGVEILNKVNLLYQLYVYYPLALAYIRSVWDFVA